VVFGDQGAGPADETPGVGVLARLGQQVGVAVPVGQQQLADESLFETGGDLRVVEQGRVAWLRQLVGEERHPARPRLRRRRGHEHADVEADRVVHRVAQQTGEFPVDGPTVGVEDPVGRSLGPPHVRRVVRGQDRGDLGGRGHGLTGVPDRRAAGAGDLDQVEGLQRGRLNADRLPVVEVDDAHPAGPASRHPQSHVVHTRLGGQPVGTEDPAHLGASLVDVVRADRHRIHPTPPGRPVALTVRRDRAGPDRKAVDPTGKGAGCVQRTVPASRG
jgi:hypothetical protein